VGESSTSVTNRTWLVSRRNLSDGQAGWLKGQVCGVRPSVAKAGVRQRGRARLSRAGKDVFDDWLTRLGDARAQAKIAVRINRLTAGNFGDCQSLRQGLSELRIDWGPGYRVYYAMIGRECVLLLCAGDKRRQAGDIGRALEYREDFKQRTHQA
jgi:putative addiction module killer protein